MVRACCDVVLRAFELCGVVSLCGLCFGSVFGVCCACLQRGRDFFWFGLVWFSLGWLCVGMACIGLAWRGWDWCVFVVWCGAVSCCVAAAAVVMCVVCG